MTTLRFLGDLSLLTSSLVAFTCALVCWWFYRKETRALSGRMAWFLPLLRCSAVALCVLVLAGPVIRQRFLQGEPGRVVILLDSSQSMAISDPRYAKEEKLRIAQSLNWLPANVSFDARASSTSVEQSIGSSQTSSVDPFQSVLDQFDHSTRHQRAVQRLLAGSGGLLESLRSGFEVSVIRFAGDQHELLWESNVRESADLPQSLDAWSPKSFGRATDLASAIDATLRVTSSMYQPADHKRDNQTASRQRRSAIVLLSDGQHNLGNSPVEIADRAKEQGERIFAVGFGSPIEPEDLAIESLEAPERLFHTDTLRGTITLKDRARANLVGSIAIKFQGEVVWERRFSTENSGPRNFVFSFPLEKLIAQQKKTLTDSVSYSAIPLEFDVEVGAVDGEADVANNTSKLYVTAVTQRVKMLILDGRSRWETRYLKNTFERDPTWMVDTHIAEPSDSPINAARLNRPIFPASAKDLFEYDVIILGELPPGWLSPTEQQWIKEFVELSGGGVIVIDGAREYLRGEAFRPLQSMLPVEWAIPAAASRLGLVPGLTQAGAQLGVFQIVGARLENETAWRELPPLQFASRVRVLPGAETLAELTDGIERIPLFATRQFGAGRVFYSATDETWRWRFRIADAVYSRLWNQIGRWVMRLPMAVHGEYLSLDSGKSNYRVGENVEIRARLRDHDGKPSLERSIEAAISDTERIVSTVALTADPQVPGVFRGRSENLDVASYQVRVRAPGFSETALDVTTRFDVLEPESKELSNLAKNAPLLRKLAESTGGIYLDEDRAHELADQLAPLSGGKLIETDYALWHSYGWFTAIVCLLTLEWWLRKRANLI